MTLLGVPDDVKFNVGSSSAAPAMDMSLDDMIASRRKEQIKAKRGSGRPKVSAADRSLGAGRAKRDAAVAARRGIRQASAAGGKAKPTAMEVEREVYRQSRQTAQTQARAINRASRGRISANAPAPTAATAAAAGGTRRRRTRRVTIAPQAGGAAAANTTTAVKVTAPPRTPSKKAVNAAVNAMQEAGYQVPTGMQMFITFAPAGSTTVAAPTATAAAATTTNTNNAPRRNNRGSGGRAGAGAKSA